MPQPWNHKRFALLTEMLLELLDEADLDDDAADEVCVLVLSKLWQGSGLDAVAFRAAVSAAIAGSEAAFSPRRH